MRCDCQNVLGQLGNVAADVLAKSAKVDRQPEIAPDQRAGLVVLGLVRS
jgi:hypothetical protein